MNLPIRIGMDTSKSVFQLHGVDENEGVVVRRQFRRAEMIRYFERLPPVLVAIESCGFASLGAPAAVVRSRGEADPTSVRVRTTRLTPRRCVRRSPARACGLYR